MSWDPWPRCRTAKQSRWEDSLQPVLFKVTCDLRAPCPSLYWVCVEMGPKPSFKWSEWKPILDTRRKSTSYRAAQDGAWLGSIRDEVEQSSPQGDEKLGKSESKTHARRHNEPIMKDDHLGWWIHQYWVYHQWWSLVVVHHRPNNSDVLKLGFRLANSISQ